MVREFKGIFRLLSILPLLLMAVMSGVAWADPPTRVGRIALIEGEVAMRRDEEGRWEGASVNWPLTTGDALSTESRSRAEIRIGSSVLRLDADTVVEIRRLDDERIRVRLKEGSVAMRVRSEDSAAAIAVETRDGLAVTTEPGQYRVDNLDGSTRVSSFRGHIDFRTDDRHVSVTAGRSAEISTDGRSDVHWSSIDRDDFSDWSMARDERDDRLGRPRHVSSEMTGVEDLYEYGDWRDYDEYGAVWFPRSVPRGWAPYRYGRWVSVAPWGPTWVDDAPWGFAPFHYGRWVQIRGSWAWVPGRYSTRPIYAPALVAWIGTPGVNISLAAGRLPDVGWFPLAPREVYVPQYRYSPNYVREINVTHVTNVTEISRVIQAPERARHEFRDRREAVTRMSEDVVRQPRFVTVDPDRRHRRELQGDGVTIQHRDVPERGRPFAGRPEQPRRGEDGDRDGAKFRDDARRRQIEREQGREREGTPVLPLLGGQAAEQAPPERDPRHERSRWALPDGAERSQRDGRDRQQQERERIDKQQREHQERQQQERLQQERLQQERLQQERLQQERLQQERLQQERLQQERQQQERLQQERQQQERQQQERQQQERQQQERQQQERLQQERQQQERQQQERQQQERQQQERQQHERQQQERERIDKQQRELRQQWRVQERAQQEQQEQQQREQRRQFKQQQEQQQQIEQRDAERRKQRIDSEERVRQFQALEQEREQASRRMQEREQASRRMQERAREQQVELQQRQVREERMRVAPSQAPQTMPPAPVPASAAQGQRGGGEEHRRHRRGLGDESPRQDN